MPEPVRTALVGYGYWGANLARNIGAADATELIGIADTDPTRRAAATVDHPGIHTWQDFESVLVDEDVEAVVLAVPASAHAAMAIAALEAGRHVLVEKPLATDTSDGAAIVDTAHQAGLIAMVGHTFLYSPAVRALGDVIASGDLGSVQYLYSQRLSLGRIRRDCNALWNFAPHDISIMLHLLSEQPVEVSARGLSFISDGIEDVVFGSLEFESGIGANIHVSWIDPRKTRLMTVVGDQKMAIYNDVSVDQKLWIVDAGVAPGEGLGEYESMGDFQWRTRAGDIVIPHIPMYEPLREEIEAFGSACQSGIQPLTSAAHGLEVVRVLSALDRSVAARGAPIEVEHG